jgi:hypothetical protein
LSKERFNHQWQESGQGESHERGSTTEGGGVFINRETEVKEREGLIINDKKSEERDWGNLMRGSMTEGGGVFINREIEVEERECLIINGKKVEERGNW